MGGSNNGNQREVQFRPKQWSYYNIFVQGKVTFMVTLNEKSVFVFTSLVLKGHM